jgi:hypothetical protein
MAAPLAVLENVAIEGAHLITDRQVGVRVVDVDEDRCPNANRCVVMISAVFDDFRAIATDQGQTTPLLTNADGSYSIARVDDWKNTLNLLHAALKKISPSLITSR